ncbi:MAG: adenosylmethionine--8-amino-7-oxononanoate transaminase, partial [Herbiconiux sp.]|nr:adenosylmethionine--8-amino-7-oxononanoate transaminase [Herbiconiux sp.]
VHGHRHPRIDAAVADQLGKVAHTTMLGLTHPLAIELAEKLVALAPGDLSRVFYSDTGAAATEIGLKMAFQGHVQTGETRRTRFAYLESSYHGDTLGAVSVGGIELFHERFRPLLFDAIKLPFGDAEACTRIIAEHADELAAVIVEPIVQGAGGLLVQPDGFLRAIREATTAAGAFLIADEVATGFGRTGTMFACEQEGVVPDILCLGKGLTGGYLPLAATIATEAIYERFLGGVDELKTFFHGHTYTGNPLGCAAAIATLEVFEEDRVLDHVAELDTRFGELLGQHVAPLAGVHEIRRRGLMCGVELLPHAATARAGHQVILEARARGVLLRPLGDIVVLMPPLAISAAELERLVTVTAEAIGAVSDRLGVPDEHRPLSGRRIPS